MSKISLKNVNNLIKNSSRTIAKEHEFLNDLEKSIEKNNEKRMPSRSYKPSSLYCLRQMYYQMIGCTPVHTDESNLISICQTGTSRHEYLQEAIIKLCQENKRYEWIDVEQYIKEKKIFWLDVVKKVGTETKCYHKILNLSFMCDGIVKIDNEYYVLELKTESTFKFQSRKDVVDTHLTQGCCYSLSFGINNVLYLYENRDCGRKKIFNKRITEKMHQERVIDRIFECDNYVNELKVPEKEKTSNCQYCAYSDQCLRDR